MTDDELIGYCAIHCETERAIFHPDHINRMLQLAGHPPGFPKSVDGWRSAHEPMKELVRLARFRRSFRVIEGGKAGEPRRRLRV